MSSPIISGPQPSPSNRKGRQQALIIQHRESRHLLRICFHGFHLPSQSHKALQQREGALGRAPPTGQRLCIQGLCCSGITSFHAGPPPKALLSLSSPSCCTVMEMTPHGWDGRGSFTLSQSLDYTPLLRILCLNRNKNLRVPRGNGTRDGVQTCLQLSK